MIKISAYGLVAVPVAFVLGCSGTSGSSQPENGGSTSLGGGLGTGGIATAAGGTSSSIGGIGNTGGAQSTGGAAATGGVHATGGASPTGGAPATGGVIATGGSKAATGGASATGGVQATGGAGTATSAAGGTKATGGANATGGASPTGGTKAAGGTSATGGQSTGAGGSTQSTTCPSTILKSGDTTETVTVGSASRTYILHVSSGYKGTTAVPLIVDFHPIGGSDTGEEGSSPFKAVTESEGVITAYPQGNASPNMGAAWDVGPCCDTSDDVAFAKALVTQVETKACIDTKRVYAVGFSMGGGMSHYLACKAADVFAAVAPASFDLLKGSAPAGNADDCKPARPIPVLSFRGTGDTIAIYAGGYSSLVTGMPITFLGAQACWEKWASINGCTDTPAYPPTPTSSAWQCAYYKQCQGNVQVGICINNGQHEYGDGTIGWTFLKQFTLP